MSEALKFVGMTLIAGITAVTLLVLRDLLGPDGVENIRRKRERLFRKDEA